MKIKNIEKFCRLNNQLQQYYFQYFDENAITEYINERIKNDLALAEFLFCKAHLNIDHLNIIKNHLGKYGDQIYTQFILGILGNPNISQETKQLFIDQHIKEHVFK